MALAVVWSVTASWLSAHQVIAVRAEVLNYKYCVLAVVCGAFYFIKPAKGAVPKQIVRWGISACALLVAFVAWHFSDKTFTHWKMRAVSASAWQQAAADIEKLAKDAPTVGKAQPWANEPNELPRSADAIGLPRDYAGGFGGTGLFGYGGVTACASYGLKPRTWGLFVGTEASVKGRWPKCSYFPVGKNAFFFVGANY